MKHRKAICGRDGIEFIAIWMIYLLFLLLSRLRSLFEMESLWITIRQTHAMATVVTSRSLYWIEGFMNQSLMPQRQLKTSVAASDNAQPLKQSQNVCYDPNSLKVFHLSVRSIVLRSMCRFDVVSHWNFRKAKTKKKARWQFSRSLQSVLCTPATIRAIFHASHLHARTFLIDLNVFT